MTALGRIASLVCAVVMWSGPARAHPGSPSPQIWFAATEPVWRAIRHWGDNDYMQLFAAGSEWSRAARRVSVFEVTKRFVLDSSDRDVAGVTAWLRKQGIALSVQMTPLVATTACGLGVEGYGPPDDMARVAEKLKRLGADLRYLRMDEPLWYGRIFNQRGRAVGCHLAIEQIAREAIDKLHDVRRVYPRVQLGDIEPVGSPAPGWTADISGWISALQSASGERLAFLHADVIWNEADWPSELRSLARLTRQDGLGFGIIYDGRPGDATDRDWASEAVGHFRLVEGQMGITPDQAIIQSWMDHPRRMLPTESDQSLTGVLATYLTWRGVTLPQSAAGANAAGTAVSPQR